MKFRPKKTMATILIITMLIITLSPKSISKIDTTISCLKSSHSIDESKTLYVGGSGPDNFTSLGEAIESASDGDTIYVFNGIYTNEYRIRKSITLIGANKLKTIIQGTDKLTLSIRSDNVTITNFTITVKNTEENSITNAIIIRGNNINITNNIIKNHTKSIIFYIPSKNNTISNNQFYNSGITFYDHSKKSIFNNTLNDKPLIYLENKKDTIINKPLGQCILFNCSNVTIKQNKLSNTSSAIQLIHCRHCIIQKNTIHHSNEGIRLLQSSNNIITENVIKNTRFNSGIIILDQSEHNIIDKNTVTGNGQYGITIKESHNNTISKNTITSQYRAISFIGSESKNTTICKNIIYENTIGINIKFVNTTVENNFFFENKNGGIHLSAYSSAIINNSFEKDGIYFSKRILFFNNYVINKNTVNGKPLVYLFNEKNKNIQNSGQIILINCQNINIKNQNISHTTTGIYMINSRNCNIENNKITNNSITGIKLSLSPKNKIERNIISDNGVVGLYINGISNKNRIIKNQITNNGNYGIYMVDYAEWPWQIVFTSRNNQFIKNNIFDNNISDTEIYNAPFNQWKRNYWNETNPIHYIPVTIHLIRGSYFGSPPTIHLNIIRVDWLSAIKPHKITNNPEPILIKLNIDNT